MIWPRNWDEIPVNRSYFEKVLSYDKTHVTFGGLCALSMNIISSDKRLPSPPTSYFWPKLRELWPLMSKIILRIQNEPKVVNLTEYSESTTHIQQYCESTLKIWKSFEKFRTFRKFSKKSLRQQKHIQTDKWEFSGIQTFKNVDFENWNFWKFSFLVFWLPQALFFWKTWELWKVSKNFQMLENNDHSLTESSQESYSWPDFIPQ